MNRRLFLGGLAAAGFARAAGPAKFKVGITDWNLRMTVKTEAVATAARLGFDGVQISCGRQIADNKMPLDNPDLIAQYIALSKQHHIPIDGTCVDRLHDNGLKRDPLAVKWVSDGIRLTKAVGTKVALIPFFGDWAIKTPEEMNYVGDALRELGKEAEKAGVILGLENTNSAEENVRMMERSRSSAVKVYYDVGNSTFNGYDVLKELRWLGKDRICQIHIKDRGMLGEGKLPFPEIIKAIEEIGFTDYANLETSVRSPQTLEADQKKNLEFVRALM